jgi:hypothetical protein
MNLSISSRPLPNSWFTYALSALLSLSACKNSPEGTGPSPAQDPDALAAEAKDAKSCNAITPPDFMYIWYMPDGSISSDNDKTLWAGLVEPTKSIPSADAKPFCKKWKKERAPLPTSAINLSELLNCDNDKLGPICIGKETPAGVSLGGPFNIGPSGSNLQCIATGKECVALPTDCDALNSSLFGTDASGDLAFSVACRAVRQECEPDLTKGKRKCNVRSVPPGLPINNAVEANERAGACTEPAMLAFCASGKSEAKPGARIEIKGGATCFVTGLSGDQACFAGPKVSEQGACETISENYARFQSNALFEQACRAATDGPDGKACSLSGPRQCAVKIEYAPRLKNCVDIEAGALIPARSDGAMYDNAGGDNDFKKACADSSKVLNAFPAPECAINAHTGLCGPGAEKFYLTKLASDTGDGKASCASIAKADSCPNWNQTDSPKRFAVVADDTGKKIAVCRPVEPAPASAVAPKCEAAPPYNATAECVANDTKNVQDIAYEICKHYKPKENRTDATKTPVENCAKVLVEGMNSTHFAICTKNGDDCTYAHNPQNQINEFCSQVKEYTADLTTGLLQHDYGPKCGSTPLFGTVLLEGMPETAYEKIPKEYAQTADVCRFEAKEYK